MLTNAGIKGIIFLIQNCKDFPLVFSCQVTQIMEFGDSQIQALGLVLFSERKETKTIKVVGVSR